MDDHYNLQAEAAILGAILLDNAAYERARDHVQGEDFYSPAHRLIWEQIARIVSAGRVADAVTLRHTFEVDSRLEEAGGAAYFADLLQCAAYGPEIIDYAAIIADLARRRALIDMGGRLALSAARGDTSEAMEAHEAELDTLRERQAGDAPVSDGHAAGLHAIDCRQALAGSLVATGLPTLDTDIGGMPRGTLTILAARPSMGKSALAVVMGVNMALSGHTVGFCSLEMPQRDVALRLALYSAWQAGAGDNLPDMADLTQNRAHDAHWAAVRRGAEREDMRRFLICDRGGLKVSDIGLQIRAWNGHARRHGLDRPSVIFVDHIGHVRPDGPSNGPYDRVSQVSNGLLALARKHDVAIVGLCQLSRQSVNERRRPGLQDLRDSGRIEEDAATVLILHREDYYAEREARDASQTAEKQDEAMARLERCRYQAEVIIAKQRNGPLGVANLRHRLSHNIIIDPMLSRGRVAQ